MILKIGRKADTEFERVETDKEIIEEAPATEGMEWTVIAGVRKYQYGYFVPMKDGGPSEMYLIYYLESEPDGTAHDDTIKITGVAYAMTDSGKTIERIR